MTAKSPEYSAHYQTIKIQINPLAYRLSFDKALEISEIGFKHRSVHAKRATAVLYLPAQSVDKQYQKMFVILLVGDNTSGNKQNVESRAGVDKLYLKMALKIVSE